MENVENLKTTVQYKYLSKNPVFNQDLIIRQQFHEQIKSKFDFKNCEIPQKENDEGFIFNTGNFQIQQEKILIIELRIGTIGISVSIWGESSIGREILDIIYKLMLEKGIVSMEKMHDLKQTINYDTSFKCKLSIDPIKFYNPELIKIIEEKRAQLISLDKIKTSVHAPVSYLSLIYEPDMTILKNLINDFSTLELNSNFRMGNKSFLIKFSNFQQYIERECIVNFECDSKTAKELIQDFEKRLK